MAQILVPVADTAAGSWTTTPLWSKVDDDSTVNPTGDGTVILSESSGGGADSSFADLELSTGTDPGVSTGHIIRARWRSAGASSGFNAVAELWQGVPGTGTLRATLTVAASGLSSETESTYTLTGTEADSITDYTDLYLRLWRDTTAGGTKRLEVELVEFEIPDASAEGEGGSTASVTVTAEGAGTPPLEIPGDLPTASVIGIWDARKVAGSVNDSVGSWADTGPKNQDPLAQATSGFQPTINESGFGGIRALLFDGTDDRLDVTLDQTYSGDFAIIVVLELLTYPHGDADTLLSTGSIPNKNLLGVDDNESPPGWVVMSGDGTQADHFHGTNDQTYLEATPSRFVMTYLVENDNRVRLWENSVLVIDEAPGSATGDLNNMPALKLGAREDDSRFTHCRVAYVGLVDMASATVTELLSAQDDLGDQFNVPGFGISGGSTADVSVSPEGAGTKQVSAGATGSVTVNPEGGGATSRSSGSTADVAVTAEGAGGSVVSGGSTANVSVSGEGVGTGARIGGATAAVQATGEGAGASTRNSGSTTDATVTPSGTGTKARSDGATGAITVVASGTGTSSESEPAGGSTANVQVTVEGDGSKDCDGGNTGSVTVSTSSVGASARSGGTTASVDTTTTTDGTKTGQSGATANIEVTASGAGSAVDLISGGSTAQITVSAEGDGSTSTSGGATANITVTVSTGGQEGAPLFEPGVVIRGSYRPPVSAGVSEVQVVKGRL